MQIEEHFPSTARHLITVSGNDLLATLGLPVVRQIIADVLTGVNVRNATEKLTKHRVNLLNGALLVTYASMHRDGIAPEAIPQLAYERLMTSGLQREDKAVLRWLLGLTQKQVQNVLRSDDTQWEIYIRSLQETLAETATAATEMYGEPPFRFDEDRTSWSWALSALMAVGSQTLATRGAEKSLYGKLFEKLVLTSVLSILGFRYTESDVVAERSFWLSSRGAKRESDATAIWRLGRAVRFDIGFIGTGNTEVTLDKVSRFERLIEMNGEQYYVSTFIIVDRIGRGSSVPDLAAQINGTIVQMSANDWVQTLGDELSRVLGDYVSPLAGLNHREYREAIVSGVADAPLGTVLSP